MTCAVVERFVRTAAGGFRRDLFGIADILAVPTPWERATIPQPGYTLLVQTCPDSHLAEHVAKLLMEPGSRLWLASSDRHQLEVHGWARKTRGYKRPTWTLRRVVLRYRDGNVFSTTPFESVHHEEPDPL
jgi:hypothetical protein